MARNCGLKFWTVHFLGLVLLGTGPRPGFAQQPGAPAVRNGVEADRSSPESQRADLARQIRQIVEQLQAVREQRRRADEEQRNAAAVLTRQIDVLRREVDSARTTAQVERQEIARLEEQIGREDRTAGNARSWIDAAATAARRVAQRTRQRIDHGAGADRLRQRSELDAALAALDDPLPARRAEGVRAFLDFAGSQWPAARSVTLANEAVLLEDGQRLEHAWVVGLGLAAKIFVSEDGRLVGLWTKSPHATWRLDLPEGTREQARQLVEVVREQRPPAIVPVPIWLAPAPTREP